jgi:hypothetical protein
MPGQASNVQVSRGDRAHHGPVIAVAAGGEHIQG